jgi:adenosine deaminase
LAPVDTYRAMRRLLVFEGENGTSLLEFLDRFHYPLWATQFEPNLIRVSTAIAEAAYRTGVRLLEVRYAPAIHSYGGLTTRQAIRAVLVGFNRARTRHPDLTCGLIVISMRGAGPHIASIQARQAIAESAALHDPDHAGVVGFDLAGGQRGVPLRLFEDAYRLAGRGGLGLTVHAGEDEGPEAIWEAIDVLGVQRIGHGCTAVRDKTLLRRLARDQILIECCVTSNYQTGAVPKGEPPALLTFLEHDIPVAVCVDNATVSNTNQPKEHVRLQQYLSDRELRALYKNARRFRFIPTPPPAVAGAPDSH